MLGEKTMEHASLNLYIENAPKLARRVLNYWGASGNDATLPADFLNLLNKACDYEAAARFINSGDEFGRIPANHFRRAQETRVAFAQEYRKLDHQSFE